MNVIGDRVFLTDLQSVQKGSGQLTVIEYHEVIKTATVAAVGDNVNKIGPDGKVICEIKIGDKILFQMPVGLPLEYENVVYQVVRRSDIWFVI